MLTHAAGCHSKDRAHSFTNGQSLDLVSTKLFPMERHKGKPRLSIFEMFYNMTALLASVALGYDVRTSNGFLLHKRCFREGSILQITSSPRITAPTRNIFTDDAEEDDKQLVKYTSNHGLFESSSRNFNNSQDTYHMNSGLEDSGAFSNNYTQSSSKLKPTTYLVGPHRRNLSESLNTHDVYLPIVDNNHLIQTAYDCNAEEDWYYRSRKNFYPMLSNIPSTNPFAREMHHSDTYGSNYFSSSLQTNDSIERGYNSYPDYRTQPEPAPRNYTFQNALQQSHVDDET